jgi:hypothetical protein
MDAFLKDVCAQQAGKGFITIRKGTQRSTRTIEAAPRDACPGPYFLRPAMIPDFPPGNWAALQMQLNFQIGDAFDFPGDVLPPTLFPAACTPSAMSCEWRQLQSRRPCGRACAVLTLHKQPRPTATPTRCSSIDQVT